MATSDLTVSLYGGLHQGTFTANSHRYKIDGQAKRGVTTIIGATLAKPSLMLWPLRECLKSLGAAYDEKTSQWLLPLDRLVVTAEDVQRAAKAYMVKRDKGADTGSDVHSAVEKFLRAYQRGELYQPSLDKDGQKAFQAFIGWWQSIGEDKQVIAVEKVIFSKSLDYAGTLDFVIKVGKRTYLCDLKTTNAGREAPDGIYPEHFIQLGAYYLAYEEERPYLTDSLEPIEPIDSLMIVSCRKDGKWSLRTNEMLGLTPEDCAEAWRQLLGLNRLFGRIKEGLRS